jgi:hypothetical protein
MLIHYPTLGFRLKEADREGMWVVVMIVVRGSCSWREVELS